jgi:HEAT repeat protein
LATDPAALPALQRALDDPDDEVRHWVADAIASQIQMPS